MNRRATSPSNIKLAVLKKYYEPTDNKAVKVISISKCGPSDASSTTAMAKADLLRKFYPWTEGPLVCCAPMRRIAHAPLAVAVSMAGGFGFFGAGEDTSTLGAHLSQAKQLLSSGPPLTTVGGVLPIGVGFLNWGADLDEAARQLRKFRPAAAWLFAPPSLNALVEWTIKIRIETGGATAMWVQVGSVAEAYDVCTRCMPDVVVVQGQDAGGHGLNKGCSIVTLVPEVIDALEAAVRKGQVKTMPFIMAAGGIIEGRGLAAALALGADGVVMGTRYLASHEAEISQGYKDEVLRASDGGQSTVRSSIYDEARGITQWPEQYGGRGVVNQTYHDAVAGMEPEENLRLYGEASGQGDEGWGPEGRMTTYAGTGVGLVKKLQSAGDITREIREEARRIIGSLADSSSARQT